MAVSAALRKKVRRRANERCEYCLVPVEFDALPACVDHIVALKHFGPTAAANLALSCYHCNSFKGDNIAGIDPETLQLTSLYHPRDADWAEHFSWRGEVIIGRTPADRATAYVLNFNDPDRVLLRQLLVAANLMHLTTN
jgi:HNH endonuclease